MSEAAVRCLDLDCGRPFAAQVADFVRGLAAQAGLSRSKTYWLRLAAEEFTTNICQHGYRGPGPIWLAGSVEADRVWVRIEDGAPAFDPRTHDPGPRLAIEPAGREQGGLGLLLALHRLDEFTYERTAGTNRSTLCMRRDELTPHPEGAENGRVFSPPDR